MTPRNPSLSLSGLLLALSIAFPGAGHADAPPAPAKTYSHSLDARLLKAVEAGTEDAVKQFLRDGADPNTKDTDKYATPVLAKAASAFINLDIINDLIAAGADLEGTSSQGATALVLASVDGHSEAIRILLKAGAKVDAPTTDGLTALMLAASAGETENVEVLLAAGADVNARSKTNGTALIYGSAKTGAGTGKLEIIRMLVQAGADVGVVATNDKDAIATAESYEQKEIANYLRTIKQRDSDLFDLIAAAYNDRENPKSTKWNDVKVALAAGANPRYSIPDGRTGLMFITYGLPGADDETIKAIVDRSDLSCQESQYGATALHLAVNNDMANLAEYLIKKGAPLHVLNKKNQTPLDMAVAAKNQKMIALLRKAEGGDAKDSGLSDDEAAWLGLLGL